MAGDDALLVEWSAAGSPLEGDRSGDACVVVPFPGGTLVAAIDGLGHGPEAADAADEAVRLLAASAGAPLTELFERCHAGLRKTRGAVVSVASFDGRASTMAWAGVGNVEAFLLRHLAGAQPAREAIPHRGGVVGYQLPPIRATVLSVSPGDTLVLATDGIRSGFMDALTTHAAPRALAQAVFERHARGTDDALVLVARYVGARP